MLIFDQMRKGDAPLRWFARLVLLGILALVFGLWQVQVLSRSRYQATERIQSSRSVRLPALRGKILDRHGVAMADNQARHRLEVYLDQLQPEFDAEIKRRTAARREQRTRTNDLEATWWTHVTDLIRPGSKERRLRGRISRTELEEIAWDSRYAVTSNLVSQMTARLGEPMVLNQKAFLKHYRERLALPLVILPKATPQQLARFVELSSLHPSVTLEPHATRIYPHGHLAAHLLGHLNRDDGETGDEEGFDYRLPDYRGVTGLERRFDEYLRGLPGKGTIQVNAASFRQRVLTDDSFLPEPGQHVRLTLDLELQKVTEKSLAMAGNPVQGAVVVMDPRNGEILAMASAPSYDPNWFVGIRDTETWKVYNSEETKPMLNRATREQYAPGSTFKIITALACLETGVLNLQTIHNWLDSPGYYQLGNRHIRDTADGGRPSRFDFRSAFIKSSNTYFIHYGLKAESRAILEMGHRFRLGYRPELDPNPDAEIAGIFPEYSDIAGLWGAGKLANVCIGQEIAATPVQMAVMAAAVANGGTVYQPTLLVDLGPDDVVSRPPAPRSGIVLNQIGVRPEHLEVVRSAMRDDVLAEGGTGSAARIPGFSVCGKTGTAEIKAEGIKDKTTWFVSFGPYEAPRYVVVVVVESGGSGGKTCAPVAGRIYQYLHQRDSGGRIRTALSKEPRDAPTLPAWDDSPQPAIARPAAGAPGLDVPGKAQRPSPIPPGGHPDV